MCSRRYVSSTLIAIGFTASIAVLASAQWLGTWRYRSPISISGGCPDSLEQYQVLIALDDGFDFGLVGPDGSDIAVSTGEGGIPVPFWIESWDSAGAHAHIWARLPLVTPDDTLLYLYYGDSTETSASDADATFEAYDGFEGFPTGSAPHTPNPGEWERYPGNPILTEGPPGAWDDHGATYASVIYDSLAGEFRMYYHGFSGPTHQIGLATSTDGLNWSKHPGNPILVPGPETWDASQVRVPMVWKEGLTDYRMIYTGLGSGGFQVGYATSEDGVVWTKHPSNPVFNDPTWANGDTENWGVMKVGSEYLMWYSDFGMRQSGIAVSTDLVNWAPHTPGPIFASSGDPADQRYSQFCAFSFKYGDFYYVLMPSYTAEANYSKNYLYRSSSPFFPDSDRELMRIVRTVGAEGEWDDHDGDTPYVFTLDIERTRFFNDELWCYYSSEGGGDYWKEGLFIEHDIADALSPAALPEKTIEWQTAGEIVVTDAPVRSGARAVRQNDTSEAAATQLRGFFDAMQAGRVSAWMRRSSISAGDYDIYLYGGTSLGCVAGLGREGDFHYWDGAFHPTGVAWAVDTWYLVTILYDAVDGLYDFTARDEAMNEIVRVEDIAFGNAAYSIDQAMIYTSALYTGEAWVDDFRLAKWCGTEFAASVGEREEYATDAPPGQVMPSAAGILRIHPNPFNPAATVRFRIERRARVTIDVYDPRGAHVARLLEGERDAGEHSVTWDGTNGRGVRVGSGIYFCRLVAGRDSEAKKMILLR
ncbi:MAG: DUF2341 domain-containing protein [Candidatus Krumholzibacteria bacterium]|nr:DUF2341 domain-containing protein [Candidatus Krumholzibacteria bacterium]